MTPPPSAPTDQQPNTVLALLAAGAPFVAFPLALGATRLAAGSDFESTIAKAGAFGWGTILMAMFATLLISITAFLCGRVVRIPAPLAAAFALLPALTGAAGVSLGVAGMLEAVAMVNPADKQTILFAGWSEASQAAVLGFCLAAGCCGGAALALALAGLARRGASDRGYRADLLASAPVLLGASWVLLMRGILAGNIARGYEAAANMNPADKGTVFAQAAANVARDESMVTLAWVVALSVTLAAIGLTWLRTKRVSALATAALVLGTAWGLTRSVDAAQLRSDAAGAVTAVAGKKLIRVEGEVTFANGPMVVSADTVSFGDDLDPPDLSARLAAAQQMYKDLHAFARDSEPVAEASFQVTVAADASAAALTRALVALQAAGFKQLKLVGTPETVNASADVPARMRLVMDSLASGPAAITVHLLDPARRAACEACVDATVEGEELVLLPSTGASKRSALAWDSTAHDVSGHAVFAPPTGDLQRWVLALSSARGQKHGPAVLLP
jgi:hypothetical protein